MEEREGGNTVSGRIAEQQHERREGRSGSIRKRESKGRVKGSTRDRRLWEFPVPLHPRYLSHGRISDTRQRETAQRSAERRTNFRDFPPSNRTCWKVARRISPSRIYGWSWRIDRSNVPRSLNFYKTIRENNGLRSSSGRNIVPFWFNQSDLIN